MLTILLAAKLGLVGFTETLAKEGAKYNILCNVIAPIAASRMTETVMPPDVLKQLHPDFIVPLVGVLAHSSNKDETGSIFEVGGGHMAKLRWERAKGLLLKPDDSMTPGTILQHWDKVKDFSEPSHPNGVADFMGLLEEAMKMGSNDSSNNISLKGKVAVITGGGAGYESAAFNIPLIYYANGSQSWSRLLPPLRITRRQDRCQRPHEPR